MTSKSTYIMAILDAIIIAFISAFAFSTVTTLIGLMIMVAVYVFAVMAILGLKDFYRVRQYSIKDIFVLLEGVFIGSFLAGIPAILMYGNYGVQLVLFIIIFSFICTFAIRLVHFTYKSLFKSVKKVLIVGAGQDGKIIAEEIQSNPELGYKVIGFLDDNMNNIEEEDSSIPILGLTYDSEAVIKDNDIDTVIIAVKSRMDSNILTDLAKGIPLGVKVWRMPTFYSHVTRKMFTSKMAVNWLFYDFVKPKYTVYSYIKRFLDIVMSALFLIVTLPLTLIAIVGIKLSDFGPIFFTQTRIGKFGRPFKMVKFRTMYQDKVDEGFDDDIEEIQETDKRVMPFCRWIRKFHIDDIPQLLNILKGDMSLVGPRPVREEVDYKNHDTIPFWECRNWVCPGLTGWQQINNAECIPEERLGYDLYYIKRRTLIWELAIYVQYLIKIVTGKCK